MNLCYNGSEGMEHMYYESYERRGRRDRGRKRGGSCSGWLIGMLFRLILLVLVLALLAAAALYALPVAFLNVEPVGMNLSLTDGLPGNRVNVLLMGLDQLDNTGQRSDAMIIASVGYDGVKLTSLMRDMVVDIPGHGRQKLNAAYAIGGPELLMRTVNQTFKLNITNYVVADFRALVDVIDALGGVVVDVDQGELKYLNTYAAHTFRSIYSSDPDKYAHYLDSEPIYSTGTMRLNGVFATGYSRIRYSDSDYVRTSRQREVLSAMLTRFRERWWDPRIYVRLGIALNSSLETNLSILELISLGEKVAISGKVDTLRLPLDGYLYDNYSTIEITDLDVTVRELHSFIYS